MVEWSQTWTFIDGAWHEGNPAIMGPRTHGAWLGSTVFDGARAFEGVTPDLDLHCARVNNSARAMGLKPYLSDAEIVEIARDGVGRFPRGSALYIRPMYWAENGGSFAVPPDPESTRFCLSIYELALPEPKGFSVMASSYRRPGVDQAPVDAKAACLYPNSARALAEAAREGFDNALVMDAIGHVAELATANVFLAKDGQAHTPYPNGSFLNGITRQRVITLLRVAGVTVHERPLRLADFREADEIFATGNYSKVAPITRFETRDLQPGPVYQMARELYWEWAHMR